MAGAWSSGALVPSAYSTTQPLAVRASHYVTPSPPVHRPEIASVQMKDRSVGGALVLTFLFGPFGLFYPLAQDRGSSGSLSIPCCSRRGFFTLGLVAGIIWIISMVWGAVGASNRHSRYQAWLVNQHGQAMRGLVAILGSFRFDRTART